jgi:ribosome-associated protein
MKKKIDFKNLAKCSAKIADDKKAKDILVLDVMKLTPITNFFVIATAESTPQITAIASDIEKFFKDSGIFVVQKECSANISWKVLDYGGLIIHIMLSKIREMYKIETLWKKAKFVDF